MAIEKIQAIRGMSDMLPEDAPLWHFFEKEASSLAKLYGYQHIRTPIVEQTRLFKRGIGEVTDIVEKEMYSFVDSLNGDELSLRPENTASVVRACIEHNLLYEGPKRLWYMGPMFRHERPQRGRYRQFHQFGMEAMGFKGPDTDAEQLLMLNRLWKRLGIAPVRLELNCLGQLEDRKAYREVLIQYFEAHKDILDEDASRRLYSNPLRILDTKNPDMQDLVNNAPKLYDSLGEESKQFLADLEAILKAEGIDYVVNPRLVRGLDYYNLTVFEWVTDKLGAQGTICGGGRYDPLIGMLGGIGNSMILGNFDTTFAAHPEMALYIPLIGGTGGNVGTQSSALVVQGLANSSLDAGNTFKQVLKESVVALINATIISMLVYIYNFIRFGASATVSYSVSISLFAVVMFASIFGTLVPMTLEKLKIDPAIATGPFISITNDIIGMLMYMGITVLLS